MTIELLEDVSPGQGLVSVSNPTEAHLDEVLQVDDEYVLVRNSPRPDGKLILGRGLLGSARATHSSGATLSPVVGGPTPAQDLSTYAQLSESPDDGQMIVFDSTTGQFDPANVPVALQIVGPVPFDYTTPQGTTLVSLAVGTIVWGVRVRILTAFNAGSSLEVGMTGSDGEWGIWHSYTAPIESQHRWHPGLPSQSGGDMESPIGGGIVGLGHDGVPLGIFINFSGSRSAGSAELYALILSPS